MAPGYTIRKAQSSDVPKLPDIEREAASLFSSRATELGFNPDAPVHVHSLETLNAAQTSDRLWVALDSLSQPVGFAHLEEMDVLPAHGRKGVGATLLEAVCTWASEKGYPAVTLSTFRDIPWNGPFYARMVFMLWNRERSRMALQQSLKQSAGADSEPSCEPLCGEMSLSSLGNSI
jgi:4-diphosphocytidyl-2-C-methyl-D-erythritol kinase